MNRGAAGRRDSRRAGITLTEILIAILILGVGIISLATLFPLGLIRMRNAQRLSRGAYLVESATAEILSRNLLSKPSFVGNPLIIPWYQRYNSTTTPFNPLYFDPFIVDTRGYLASVAVFPDPTATPPPSGPGRFFVYDPVWRCVTGLYPDPVTQHTPESRFASGIGLLRNDPNPIGTGLDNKAPSAHGLQRLSNFPAYWPSWVFNASAELNAIPWFPPALSPGFGTTVPLSTSTVLQTFISPEDMVTQEVAGVYPDPNAAGSSLAGPSTIVPDMSIDVTNVSSSPLGFRRPALDWRYTYFVTGRQADVNDDTTFDVNIVICENRPFDVTTPTLPFATLYANEEVKALGETVVEAVWGWTSSPDTATLGVYTPPGPPPPGVANWGYGARSASRSVLLRWPATVPDPDMKVGYWIADVTYDRHPVLVAGNTTETTPGRFPGPYPAQRCYWYQVAKRTEPEVDVIDPTYRSMTVRTTTPLQALTWLDFTSVLAASPPPGAHAVPVHVEAALIMPSVVNVYPRTITTR